VIWFWVAVGVVVAAALVIVLRVALTPQLRLAWVMSYRNGRDMYSRPRYVPQRRADS
jgi:hypothetical protein